MLSEAQLSKAVSNAEKISAAIRRKLGDKFVTFVRLIDRGSLQYVELAAKPVGGPPTSEVQTAYGAKYFFEMEDIATMQARGRRILRDIQVGLGLPTDDAASDTAAKG